MDTAVDRKPGKKRKIIILIIIIVTAVLLIAGFTGYFLGEHYYGSHFMKGTIVNGIDVSKMSVEELEDKIQDEHYTMTQYRAPGLIAEHFFGVYLLYLKRTTNYRIKETELVFWEKPQKNSLPTNFNKCSEKEVVLVSNFNNNY